MTASNANIANEGLFRSANPAGKEQASKKLEGNGGVFNQMEKGSEGVRRYIIVGERRFSNYWWTCIILLGSFGFLYTGLSSYLGQSLLSIIHINDFVGLGGTLGGSETFKEHFDIPFFPQGLLMSFYGSLGILLSIYWVLLIFWNVGGGFNEFNKKDGLIRIFRWGYPGKNRKIDLLYSLKDVEAIRVEIKQGFDPQRTIFLKLKGNSMVVTASEQSIDKKASNKLNLKREIPLSGISQPLTLKEIEKQASELANFLQVSLEGL
jgi:hypothetical protein